jgi:hypothetical protein
MNDIFDILTALLRSKPDYLLMLITLLATFVFGVIQLFVRGRLRRKEDGPRAIVNDVLANAAIQQRIKDNTLDVSDLVDKLLHKLYESDVEKQKNLRTTLVQKVMNDITWDVAGLIGMGVTVVLLFMVVSRTWKDVPPELFAGWTTILGYYFGKAAKQ